MKNDTLNDVSNIFVSVLYVILVIASLFWLEQDKNVNVGTLLLRNLCFSALASAP